MSVAIALSVNGPVTFSGRHLIALSGATTLSGTGSVNLTVNNATTLSGVISGSTSNPLVIAGIGTLTLNNANSTYAGGTTLNAISGGVPVGTLAIGSSSVVTGGVLTNGPVGVGPLTLTGGILQTTGGAQTLANPVILNAIGNGVQMAGAT